MNNHALVVVDMLYDFIDGSLACQNAESAVAQTVKYIARQTKGMGGEEHEILDTFPILFIRDHHPADHSSFKEQAGIWPPHCVAGTHGGEIHEDLQKMNLESRLEQVLAGVPYAIFGRDAADIYVSRVQQFQNLAQRLAGLVDSFESGVLLHSLVATLVKCEFLVYIRQKVFMYLTSSGSGNAVRRPYATLLLEGRMVGRMMVTDE